MNNMTKSEKFFQLGGWATAAALLMMGGATVGVVGEIPELVNITLPLSVAAWGVAIGAMLKHFVAHEQEQEITYPEQNSYVFVHERIEQLRHQSKEAEKKIHP